MKPIKVMIIALAIMITLLSSTVVMAQTSSNFSLGCWSVITSGGGARASTNYQLSDSLGQVAVGTSLGSATRVHSGYVQDWSSILRPPGDNPTPPVGSNVIYLPFVSLSVVRQCD